MGRLYLHNKLLCTAPLPNSPAPCCPACCLTHLSLSTVAIVLCEFVLGIEKQIKDSVASWKWSDPRFMLIYTYLNAPPYKKIHFLYSFGLCPFTQLDTMYLLALVDLQAEKSFRLNSKGLNFFTFSRLFSYPHLSKWYSIVEGNWRFTELKSYQTLMVLPGALYINSPREETLMWGCLPVSQGPQWGVAQVTHTPASNLSKLTRSLN